MMQKVANGYDVIIVGGGPAGLCAAMYAGRGMLKALTIERGAPGGELLNTDLIEDYIGFESIKGDRKSTRLNSSHSQISYAVFCLKKKKLIQRSPQENHYIPHPDTPIKNGHKQPLSCSSLSAPQHQVLDNLPSIKYYNQNTASIGL